MWFGYWERRRNDQKYTSKFTVAQYLSVADLLGSIGNLSFQTEFSGTSWREDGDDPGKSG